MTNVPIAYGQVASDFLYRFRLPESLRQDVFDRYFSFNFPATYWRLMCETFSMMNFEIEIARSRMEFFLCLCYLLDNPKLCSRNYSKNGRKKRGDDEDGGGEDEAPNGGDERTFTVHTAQGEDQVPRFVMYLEYLQQEPPESKEKIRGAFAGYRVHVVVLDPTLDIMAGFQNLCKINERRTERTTSSLLVDAWQRVRCIQDVHMMFQSFNAEVYRNPAKYLNWTALNVYHIMSIAEAVSELDISDACFVQRSSDNYENADEKRLKFPYANLVFEVPFYAICPKSIFSCLLPMNVSTESSLINTDDRSRALMAASLRHKNTKAKQSYQPPRIHEQIARDIENRKRTSASPWDVMNQGPLIEQVVRNLSGCEFVHVKKKFEWYFKRREAKQLEFKNNAVYDVFDAAPIDVIDSELDALGNFVAWVFDVGDKKLTIKNTHKLLWTELTAAYTAHPMEPGLRLSVLATGDASKGKSFILELLRHLLIEGSIEFFTDISNKVLNNENADFHGTVMAFHEALNRILGVGADGKKDDNEGDATIKTLMAEGRLRIIKSVQDEHTGEWKFNDVSKIMAVVVIMNTNAPEYNIPETIQARTLIVPAVDVERDHHNISSMTYSREIFGKNTDVDGIYNQFRKIDFLMFAAFQFVSVGLLPQPDITLCHAVFNMLGAHIRQKYGIDVFSDGRAFEMYKLICRVYTVLNAVLIEFCMHPSTEIFDFKHLIRLAKHFVSTEQVAVLAFSFIFSNRFFDKNLATPFRYMLQDARCYREQFTMDESKHVPMNPYVQTGPMETKTTSGPSSTDIEGYTLVFGDSSSFHALENGVDYDYFVVSTTGSANGSRDHEDIVADKMVQALRKRKIDMSRYKMKTYIRWLKRNNLNGKQLGKFDPVLQKFCILRAWIEKTYTSDYQMLNTTCFEALHHKYTTPKRCMTMETLVHMPISMPHLLQTVNLKPNPDVVLRDTVALHEDVLGLEYDDDLEELFRRRFTKITGLHTVPNRAIGGAPSTNYPETHRRAYEEAQLHRGRIAKGTERAKIRKFTEVIDGIKQEKKTDGVR